MGFFDKKIQQAQENAMQQAGAQQQAAMQQSGFGGGAGGYDPMEAMRQAGMDPNAALAGAMANPGNVQDQIAYRDRIQKLNASGVEGIGTVTAVRESGASAGGVGIETEVDVAVSSGPGAPSNITVKQSMVGDPGWYQPGSNVKLKIDPDDPSSALLSGQA